MAGSFPERLVRLSPEGKREDNSLEQVFYRIMTRGTEAVNAEQFPARPNRAFEVAKKYIYSAGVLSGWRVFP